MIPSAYYEYAIKIAENLWFQEFHFTKKIAEMILQVIFTLSIEQIN
jgi:hypothetical protein